MLKYKHMGFEGEKYEGGFYHLFNRGNEKKIIFHNESDYARFLFLVLYFQETEAYFNIGRYIKNFLKTNNFNPPQGNRHKNINKVVEVSGFAIMPNHFHLIVREVTENGVSFYMQRVLAGYAKYYNAKYNKTGHVFQGKYKLKEVTSNKQLLYLSTYIHKNPKEIGKNYEEYRWSSFQDFYENRFPDLLFINIIAEQFKNFTEFKKFTKNSIAKEMLDLEGLTND